MQFTGISIVSVPVKDQQVSKKFYTEDLGFSVVRDDDWQPGKRWIQLSPTKSAGGPMISLVTWFGDRMPPGSANILLETADVDTVHKELIAKKVLKDDAKIESAMWGRWVTVADPDGNTWIMQTTETHLLQPQSSSDKLNEDDEGNHDKTSKPEAKKQKLGR